MPILVPSPSLTLTACWLRKDIWEQAARHGGTAGDNISQWNFPRPMAHPNVVVVCCRLWCYGCNFKLLCQRESERARVFLTVFPPEANWQCRGLPHSRFRLGFGLGCGSVWMGMGRGGWVAGGPDIFIVCLGRSGGKCATALIALWLNISQRYGYEYEAGPRKCLSA